MEKVITVLKSIIIMVAPQLKKADSQVGVKELREALKAVLAIALLLLKRFKDGVQLEDFGVFWTKLNSDEEFKAIVKEGFDNYKAISVEVKDIDAGEGLEVAGDVVDFVPQFLEEFKKEEEPKNEEVKEEETPAV